MDLLEVTVVQRAKPELGYLTSLAVGEDLIVAAGGTTSQAPTVLASSNARHFEARTTPRQLGLRDIVIDGDALWTCGEYGQLAVSRDRGESWQLIDTSTDACLFGLAIADDGALWVCGNAGYFARVHAERLERIDLGTSTRLAAVYAIRDEVITLGSDGVIYRWRQGAITRIETGATKPLTGLAITKHSTWLVTGDGGFIARSPDGQWFSRARSGVEVDLEAIAALDGRVVIVGDRGLILQSRDDGRTWQPIDTDDTAHLWSIEPFGTGALIGGDNGLVLKLAARGDRTWQERVNVFGGARPLDATFARGPDGFVDGESIYSELYGVALPPPLTRTDLKEIVVEAPSIESFEARVLRDQQDDLATSLTDAFCGTYRIGSQSNGDSYHLELYEWDGPRQVLHFDHEAHAFTGVIADSLDSLVYHAALTHAHEHHELSDQAYEAGLRHLHGRIAPTLDAKRRDTEFFFYRSRWITAVLDNTEMAEIPTLFMADFNQIVPAEQLPARFEACEKVIPTALYSMWRAYLFDEPELPRYLELGRRHKAGLVRDAATLIDALLAGRNNLGAIDDMRARLAAFRQLDLDPRRAGARKIEADARAVLDEARRESVESELRSGSFSELAWKWLDDRIAHRALLAKLDGSDELAMLEELSTLPDDERVLVIERFADTLSPELEAILVGSLVRNDDLAGALPDRALTVDEPEDDAELAPGWDAIDTALKPLYGGAEPLAHFNTVVPYSLGGKDPLHGLSVYLREDHFHIITYGFTDLFIKESDAADVSGFGFELTMRVARRPDENTAPVWPLTFLQNLARYVFTSGNHFDVGHKMGLNGPIAEDTGTKITAIVFTEDPELREPFTSAFGRSRFLQVIGITDDEYALTQEWATSGLVEILRTRNQFLVTDLARDSVLADPTVAATVHARVEAEGSSEDMSFAGEMEITVDEGVRIELGALYAAALPRAMRGRLRHGRPYTLRGKHVSLRLTPGPTVSIVDGDPVELTCSPVFIADVQAQLHAKPTAGTYRFESWPALELVVTPTIIRDQAGRPVDVKGVAALPEEGPDANQVRAALAMTERALRLAPEDPDTLFTHAILLLDADRAGIPGRLDELLASLPSHSPHNRLNITLRITGPRFADAVDILLDDLPNDDELLGELADAIFERAPNRVGRLIAELPNSVNLLSTVAYKAIEAERTDAALALYDRLLDLPIPDDDSAERTNYLRALNNACIQAHDAKAHDLAVRIADRAQPYAHENPHIYHSAACAYAAVGNYSKAFEQVKLAVEHDYEHVDKIEVDVDLGQLVEWPQFQALFRDWHARKEGN